MNEISNLIAASPRATNAIDFYVEFIDPVPTDRNTDRSDCHARALAGFLTLAAEEAHTDAPTAWVAEVSAALYNYGRPAALWRLTGETFTTSVEHRRTAARVARRWAQALVGDEYQARTHLGLMLRSIAPAMHDAATTYLEVLAGRLHA